MSVVHEVEPVQCVLRTPGTFTTAILTNRPKQPEKSTEANEKALTETPDGEEPNNDEKSSLRHVAENLPLSAWLIAFIELCERFTYYGMQGLFQNYVELPLDGSQGRGALGMGHQGATGLTTFFQFWCYGRFIYVSRAEYGV